MAAGGKVRGNHVLAKKRNANYRQQPRLLIIDQINNQLVIIEDYLHALSRGTSNLAVCVSSALSACTTVWIPLVVAQ